MVSDSTLNELSRPKVSIGIPVYNGEAFIRRAIDSILAQDFDDYELIISDNASIDATEKICREYAALDSRIKFTSQAVNMGPFPNFAFVLREARGDYFMWVAADDERDPSYVRECVDAMRSHDVGLVCTQNRVLNPDLRAARGIKPYPAAALNASRFNACMQFLLMHHFAYCKADFIYGLFETATLCRDFEISEEVGTVVGNDTLFVYQYICEHGVFVIDQQLSTRNSTYYFPELSLLRRMKRLVKLVMRQSKRRRQIEIYRRALIESTRRHHRGVRGLVLRVLCHINAMRLYALF